MTRINCTASNESFPSCFLTESVGLKPVYMYFVRGLRCRDCKTNCYDIGNGSEGPQGSLSFRHFFSDKMCGCGREASLAEMGDHKSSNNENAEWRNHFHFCLKHSYPGKQFTNNLIANAN